MCPLLLFSALFASAVLGRRLRLFNALKLNCNAEMLSNEQMGVRMRKGRTAFPHQVSEHKQAADTS